MKIVIASDHAGYRLKGILKDKLEGYDFIDAGTVSENSCDYPDYDEKAELIVY